MRALVFALLMALVLVLLVIACDQAEPVSRTSIDFDLTIRTVEHDQHRWVVANGKGTALVHHPDCRCIPKPLEK